jgi:acyl-coenzyme A synthetase/AMP-(fatty) acid ligase
MLTAPVQSEVGNVFVATTNNRGFTPEELIAHCKIRLAAYKCPKQIFFVSELPRNAMGKVVKNELKSIFSSTT